jgi:hypothetical protein
MLFNRDSTIQKSFRKFCSQKSRFPTKRPDAHLSIVSSVRTPDRPSIICPDDVPYRPDLHYFEKLLFQLASVRTSQQPVWTPLNDRSASNSFQVQFKVRLLQLFGRCGFPFGCAHTKARIAIQISPSGRQLALVRMRVHQLRKLPIRLQPSGRLPIMVRTLA